MKNDGPPLEGERCNVVDGAYKSPNSEMPRLKRFLTNTFRTWLPMVTIASAVGGILSATTLNVNHVGSFFGGMILFFGVVALPCLFIVAIYVLAEVGVRRRGLVGTSHRLGLAIGAAFLVVGLMVGSNLITTDEPILWWQIRMKYQSWLLSAVCFSPVLVFIHGRVTR